MNPKIGIIGGSGLYSMPGFEAQEERTLETPWGPPSDVYVVGKLAGKEVAFLARHGRGHRLSPSEPDSVIGKFIDKRGEGLHHIALKVPDLLKSVERLRSAGARILNEPRTGAGGHLYVFVHPASTGGVLLELIQA